jgi:uncharacterized protein (TIGR03083 family)
VPTSLTFSEHLSVLESSGDRLADFARQAGMERPVPTCPAWATDALVAHLAMVHRWATAHVRGDDPAAVPNQTDIRTTVGDLLDYYGAGLAALLDAFRGAAPDLLAMTFLNDAPAPREFWARRQAHETTVHMVDALAASLGRCPTADEAAVESPVAADGVDELLCGFFTRGRSKLYDGTEFTVAVVPEDVERIWLVSIAERLSVEPDATAGDADAADATITGTAAQLYLALWNRGREAQAHGGRDVLEQWRAVQRVKWS